MLLVDTPDRSKRQPTALDVLTPLLVVFSVAAHGVVVAVLESYARSDLKSANVRSPRRSKGVRLSLRVGNDRGLTQQVALATTRLNVGSCFDASS